jgi:excinuclease ABC subunit A
MDWMVIRGARQHNLKNIDLSLPRNRFIVITGVSGSGKSTLAFDTIFAEGQRRYLEALSTRTRQFMQRLDTPKVDAVEGLSPAIAVGQGRSTRNPRSTVGTLTEIHDFLRLLYARLGVFHCPTCGSPVRAHTIPRMVQEITDSWPAGTRLLILGPAGILREGELPRILSKFRRDGFARVRLEDRIYELDPPPLVPRRTHYKAEVVVDRLILGPDKTKRLADALELASKIGRGVTGVAKVDGEEKHFSELHNCLSCGRQMPEPAPSLFSFNHPSGACPSCRGLGYLVEDSGKGSAWAAEATSHDALDPEAQSASLTPFHRPFSGNDSVCPDCEGSRLNEIARSVRLGDLPIQEASRLPVTALGKWLGNLPFTPAQSRIAQGPNAEILNRLKSLQELGLGYLTLERSAPTLSGGEMQRLRLAHQISTPLSGVLYVLDEPSIGLHPRDHDRLLRILQQLRDKGNTVIVVEHDRETILKADFIVDMGPGAGVQGGEVIFSGPPEALIQDPASLTGSYLSGQRRITVPKRRTPFEQGAITLVGAGGHNLKRITVSFPLGCVTCVTGVSGSGKTTLVMHTLYRTLARHLYRSKMQPSPCERLENADAFRRVILVDQTPLGRSSHSTPATYSGAFSAIRELFAKLPEARARGYGSKRFSFNVKGGRCESCRGEGAKNIDMLFLPDVSVTCPDCEGRRYNRETLHIQFKGHSIADILDMTVAEAFGLFGNIPAIAHKLGVLIEVGLGYLQLGQSATTLSGGEAQRVKLAVELSRRNPGTALYILDEPTIGLHFADIQRLLHVLQRLVDQGHTVIMIEHHPEVIKTADYVVDLGPEGGDQGGYLVATGTPEEIAENEISHTGRFLRQILEQSTAVGA